MRHKFLVLLVMFGLFVLMSLFGCGTANDTESDGTQIRPIELSMVTFWPATHPQVSEGHMSWIREVEERTEGRVKINLHAGESLLGAREIFNGVAAGVADIGSTCPSYTPGMFPLSEVYELPGYQNVNSVAASMTAHYGYKDIREQLGVDEFNEVKVLMFWATGPGNIMGKFPVNTLEDVQRLEIRAVGGSTAPVRILGAVPHAMPMSEAYLALDQGLVNSILGPNDILEGFRLAEVVDYLTETPFLYNMAFVKVMNKKAWNALPEEVREVFEELNDEFALKYGKLFADASRQGLKFAKDRHGLEKIELSENEEKRWQDRLTRIVDDWIREKEAQGLPGSDAVSIVRELDAKYSQKYGDF